MEHQHSLQAQLQTLEAHILSEKQHYSTAVKDDKGFRNARSIRMKIKLLEKELEKIKSYFAGKVKKRKIETQ